MEVFSHGLWSAIAYKTAERKIKRPFNIWLAVFFGLLPDLFAFAVPFTILFWRLIAGSMTLSDWPRPHGGPNGLEPPANGAPSFFPFTNTLYSISHSAVIFLVVFAFVSLILRRPLWEMGAWLMHILMDIPTHTYRFYPTPFLWPISGWKFEGFSWATPWFLIVNYSLITIALLLLRQRNKKRESGLSVPGEMR